MTQGIKDKVVVITGASSGLGEATARHLARHGARLVLGARRIQALAQELAPGDGAAVQTDVTDYGQVRRLAERAVGGALRYRRCASAHESSAPRPHHQRLVGGRP